MTIWEYWIIIIVESNILLALLLIVFWAFRREVRYDKKQSHIDAKETFDLWNSMANGAPYISKRFAMSRYMNPPTK